MNENNLDILFVRHDIDTNILVIHMVNTFPSQRLVFEEKMNYFSLKKHQI